MALLGNMSVLHKSPAKYTTGTVGYGDRANWNKPGMMRSRGDTTVSTMWKYDAIPSGMVAGRAFFPPKTAGRIVTRASFSVAASAVGSMGKPGAASASFAVNATSIGGLIAGGVANCTITINGTAAVAGLAAGRAASAIAISASAVPGATAWGVASGTMTVTGVANGFGRGYMAASTVDNYVLTPASITAAVWSAQASSYNDAGTMGAKINSAASGGVDYASMADAVRAELQAELLRITELAELHGLVVGTDLVVTSSSRTAGTVVQTIATASDTTTVSRAP